MRLRLAMVVPIVAPLLAPALVVALVGHPGCASFDGAAGGQPDAGPSPDGATPTPDDAGGGDASAAPACGSTLAFARSFGAPDAAAGFVTGLATGVGGDVFLTGTLESPLDLGGGPVGTAQGPDVFAATFSAAGAHATSSAESDAPELYGLAAAQGGDNRYSTTLFKGTTTAYDGAARTSVGYATLVVRHAPTTAVRAFSSPTGGNVFLRNAAPFSGNGVYAFGDWTSSLGATVGGTYKTEAGGANSRLVLARLFTAVNVPEKMVVWSSTGVAIASGVATDPSGGAFLTGRFTQTLSLDATPLTATSDTNDAFVARVASDLTVTWAARVSGSVDEEGLALAAAPDGGVFVAGVFSGSVDAPGGAVTTKGDEDVFVARFDKDGAVVWLRTLGGVGKDRVSGIAVHQGCGVVLVGGAFLGPTFDAGGRTLTNAAPGKSDVFLVSLAPGDGATLEAAALGGAGDQKLARLAVDPTGGVVIAGTLDGPLALGERTLTPVGARDLWLARLVVAPTR